MKKNIYLILTTLLLLVLACNLPSPSPAPTSTPADVPPTEVGIFEPTAVLETSVPEFTHELFPASSVSMSKRVYDVISVDTAPEKRAPYGDSYDINRLERPFTQDMTYVADLDIITFNLSSDNDWYYVSIELVGKDPNNDMDIRYGVEIDNDADGYGDVIIWANAPYTQDWTNDNVKVYEDMNHNTGGLSALKSDAPLSADGYETPIFDLPGGLAEDPDLAWVRTTFNEDATIQFAFKKSLTDGEFMLGVIADAGLRDVGQLDYVDRFTEADAGSPVRSNQYYPLNELYLVDNTCREAYGFAPTGYEPQLCPPPVEPTREPGETGCTNPGQYSDESSCTAAGCAWVINPNSIAAVVYYCTYP